MSAKVTVSYEHPEELREVVLRLKDIAERPKLQPAKGKYKRAYLIIKGDKN